MPWLVMERHARWLALAAIDAFFAWTEHIFIHLVILQGNITVGPQVAQVTGAEWADKFKLALDIKDSNAKAYYDTLGTIRRQFRNFVAHGAFGKAGETFSFHSAAGAVPVAFDSKSKGTHCSLIPEPEFVDAKALETLKSFVSYVWSGTREPAKQYIQDSGLPLILPMASDGRYKKAMESLESMEQFLEYLTPEHDNSANMDW